MKTSNKILTIAYAVVVITMTILIFSSRPLVEKAIMGRYESGSVLVK